MVERLVRLIESDGCARDGTTVNMVDHLGDLGGLDGAYAVAWEEADGSLHLARDPVGARSLYWGRANDGRVLYSTRLIDLLRAGAGHNRELDSGGLLAFLTTAYVPGERTLIRGVSAVPPGVELIFDRDGRGPRRRSFALMPPSPSIYESEARLRERLRCTLEQTVERLLTHGPHGPDGAVAASLSGGIDSSLVVALAARRRPVHTLSITFGPEHRDEVEFSALVARHCGATHEVVVVRPEDILTRFDATVGALSEPNGDPLTVPNDLLFEAAARSGHRVVLNGEGGDPCFGGPKNAPLLLSELYGDPDEPFAGERAYLRSHQKLWDDLDHLLEPGLIGEAERLSLLSIVTPGLCDPRWPSFLDRLMAMNVAWKGAGHILPKVEHLAAKNGVLARSPLFDWALVRLAFELPPELKRSGSIEKYLLKEALRDTLPERIIERPKSGMMVPVEAWFQGPLRAFARERLLDGLAHRPGFRRPYLEALLDKRLTGLRPRRGVKIWLLLTLESWLRQVYDSP